MTSQTINYTYDHSGRLIHEQISRTLNSGETSSLSIAYLYDCNTIIGMVYNGATYYFERNIQGDVVGVYDSTGTKVVTFKYDAFGRCTVSGNSTLAQWCKIRYRGYYFDAETGFYWVQTRYYNPDWCRWISPDNVGYLDPETPHGINLYIYCGSDPINYVDPSGHLGVFLTALVATLAGALIGGGVEIVRQAYNEGNWNWNAKTWNWWNIGGATLLGAASGLAYGLGGIAGGIVKGSIGAISVAGKAFSVSQSVGLLLGAAITMNFAAGIAGYAMNVAGAENEEFNIQQGILAGIGQTGKGVLSFFTGGMYSGMGIWKIGKNVKNPAYSIISRSVGRFVANFIPNTIFEELF